MCIAVYALLKTRFFLKTHDWGSESEGPQLLVLPTTQLTLPFLHRLQVCFFSSSLWQEVGGSQENANCLREIKT